VSDVRPCGEDAVAEPGDGIAASLDDISEQRIVGAVADAENSLEVRQSDELGGAGRDGNGDGHTALLRGAMLRLTIPPGRASDFKTRGARWS
jgi:hypothetical protein